MNCIALFNHEEIGSVSTSGAESSLIPFLLQRLSPTPAAYAQSVTRSFLVSADMGHAVHPNFASKHEDNHAPRINGGVVIKTNAKQRYASDAIGSFIVKKLIEKKGGKVQEFEVRNDMCVGATGGGDCSLPCAGADDFATGRVDRLWAPCFRRSACALWTSAVLCCPCIRFARPLARTMCRTTSISSRRFLRASLSWTSRSRLSKTEERGSSKLDGCISYTHNAEVCTNLTLP